LNWRFWKKKKQLEGVVSTEAFDSGGSYLVASTERSGLTSEVSSIRGRLQKARLIEATLNTQTATKIAAVKAAGVEYPDDYNDFQDYLDACYYVPFVARAIDIKHAMIWNMGYDLESKDEGSIKSVEKFLKEINADITIRDGSRYALIFGNMYWRIIREKGRIRLEPLNPMFMGIKLDKKKEKIESYVYKPKLGKTIHYKPEEILHLKFNAEPWAYFGVSSLRRCLPTIKALLFMEEKLPWIARRRGDPLLEIQIGGPENPVDKATFNKIKASIINRKPTEDIFHDGVLKIEEVYKTAGIAARQTLEPLLQHFRQNLVAGLGVPDVALGFGGTTTMATAEYQERLLESEIRAYQRALKRLHEQHLFNLVRTRSPVKLVWRPLKEEDKRELSKQLQGEIEHGIISPAWAAQRLGYPPEARKGAVINQNLVPFVGDSEDAEAS